MSRYLIGACHVCGNVRDRHITQLCINPVWIKQQGRFEPVYRTFPVCIHCYMSWQYNPGFVQFTKSQQGDEDQPPTFTIKFPVKDKTEILGNGTLRTHGYLMTPGCVNVWRQSMTTMYEANADCNGDCQNPHCKRDPSDCARLCRLVAQHKGNCDCLVKSEKLTTDPGYKAMKRFATRYPLRRVRRRTETGSALAVPKSGEHVRTMIAAGAKAPPPSPPVSVPKLPPPPPPDM